MEIPFYYSFKEFETNYKTDLENFLKVYPDADEKDFLYQLVELYGDFIEDGRYNDNIEIEYFIDEYPEYYNSPFRRYVEILEEQIEKHIKKIVGLNDDDSKPENINYLDFWDDFNSFSEVTIIPTTKHKYLKAFFTSNSFLGLLLDEVKYKNFGFSMVKIWNFVTRKLLQFNTSSNAVTENISTKNVIEKGNNLNLKIAMLENMDVLKWLENNIPNKTNRAEIIAKLIGGSPITIEDYLDGKNPIKNDVKQNAIDFINEKKYNSI